MRVPSPSMVVALAALFVALGGVGVAATGGNFILGQSNSADKTTALGVSTLPSATTCPAPCPALRVSDTSTAANAGGLQVTNKSTSPAAQLTNNGGGQALKLFVTGGVAPFTVNSGGKVTNLNADKLDGTDSSGLLRNTVPLSLTGSAPGTGVLTGTNTGSGNGVQGETAGGGASGVYGQNDGAGYGVFGRSNQPGGIGVAGEALGGGLHAVSALASGNGSAMIASNTGSGTALELHTAGAAPMAVDSGTKVDNLNADKIDGLDSTDLVSSGRILANRLTAANAGDILLNIPGWGNLSVYYCNGNYAMLEFNTAGTGPVDLMYSGFAPNNPGDAPGEANADITNVEHIPTPGVPGATVWGGYTLNIARDTGPGTKIVTIWVSWYAVGCRFQAQALESPKL